MRAFRFSAEAALQLRRREHEQTLVRQAAAERAVMAADAAVATAAQAVRDADARLMRPAGAAMDVAQMHWHVAWRTRCIRECERLEAERQQQQVQLQQARAVTGDAHRRVRSLERLRERAFIEWTRLVDLEERKTMDALAVSQFVRRKDDR